MENIAQDSLSTTERRRKQTVIAYSHSEPHNLPDVTTMDTKSPEVKEENSPLTFTLANLSPVEDEVFETDEEEGSHCPKKSQKSTCDTNGDLTNGNTLNENYVAAISTNSHQNTTSASNEISGIVYDDTQPRRLSHARPHKLDLNRTHDPSHTLHESINRLISPDDPEDSGSPKRRNRKQLTSTKSAPVFGGSHRKEYSSPDGNGLHRCRIESTPEHEAAAKPRKEISPENKPLQNVLLPNYKRSPDTRRRKVSSPVQRLMVKNSPLAAAAAACSKDRTITMESRLGHYYDRSSMPPRRKISSDARLEHRYVEEQQKLPANTGPKRKVSFDTTTLVNGRKMMPLNDEYTVKEEPERLHEGVSESYDLSNSANTKLPTSRLTIPTLVLTSPEEDEGIEQSEKENQPCNDSNTNSEVSEEGYASGCDNPAYLPDEYSGSANDMYSAKPGQSRLQQSDDEDEENVWSRRFSPAVNQSMTFDEAAIIPHSVEQTSSNRFNVKKVSTSSLPGNIGRKTSTGSDLSTPRSILKNRSPDADSLVSEDSIAGKKFKVRKDSIALFMDHHGQVAIEELRKEHDGKFKCFGRSTIKQLWRDRKMFWGKYKLHIVVLVLFIFTFAFVVVGLHYHSEHNEMVATSRKVFFEPRKRHLTLGDPRGADTLSGTLGLGIPLWMMPTHCHSNYESITDKSCLKWKDHGQLDIAHFTESETHCYNITWNLLPGISLYDCYNTGNRYWYGPLNTTASQWPIRSKGFTFNVNNTKHYGSGSFSSAIEYYWLSSKAEAVVVDSHYPLEISWNTRQQGAFCIIWNAPAATISRAWHNLSYAVCNGDDLQNTHALIRKKYYPAVTKLPEKSFLQYPHWSAVADSDSFNLNYSNVENVMMKVRSNRMNCSSIEIDGKWERKFGDLYFDTNDFGNLTELHNTISESGCKLSLDVYPYFDFHSVNFLEGMSKEYFIRDLGGSVPGLVKWEHGIGAMLDVSNPGAREWFSNKLRKIASKYGISTFRLVYGSSSWIPSNPMFHLDNVTPTSLKLMFSDLLSSLGNAVVESTSHSQHISTLIGISSSVVNDGKQYCLKNIIPDVLNLGIMGYPFVMSDGFDFSNTHKSFGDFLLPSRDLYIRWMQLSSFFPAIRYTVKPWNYDTKVVVAARNLTEFRSKTVVTAIYQYEKEILNGAPILQPMWWRRSRETDTLLIDDQFILADTFLVAPVLCECRVDSDVAERDIYIPNGVWKDVNLDKVIIGPKWLRQYRVSQFQIPLFERMPEYGEE